MKTTIVFSCLAGKQISVKSVFCLKSAWCMSSLVLFLLFASCSSAPRESVLNYTDFPQTIELKGRVVQVDSFICRYPYRIRVKGDRALLLDLHGPDYYFHLFSYPDFRHLSSFGRRGEGPKEYILAENIRWYGNSVYTLDSGRSKLSRFDFTPSSDSLYCSEEINLDKQLLNAPDFVHLDDSTFLIPDYSGDSRINVVSRDGRLLRRFGTIPTTNAEALQQSRPALAQAWRSFIDYNPRNHILAAATQLGEVIEIWNLNDSTHTVCMGPAGEPQFHVVQGFGIPVGIMGFSDIQVTDRAIYAIFSGTTFEEIKKSIQDGTDLASGGRYLYVFSFEGKPLKRYQLDHFVSGICIDEQKGVMLATDVNSDEPFVEYRFEEK